MEQKEFDKTKKILEKHYSLHEVDVLIAMIQDEEDEVEDVEDYMTFCDFFSDSDFETSYDNFLTWKKNMREEIVQDITLNAAYMLEGREYDSRALLTLCRELADEFEKEYPSDIGDDYMAAVDDFTESKRKEIQSLILS